MGGMNVHDTEKELNANVMMRLKRIEGQVRGIQRMVEEQCSCSDILNQVAAVKSAITQVGIVIFRNHAQECILNAIHEDDMDGIEEMVTLMSRMIK